MIAGYKSIAKHTNHHVSSERPEIAPKNKIHKYILSVRDLHLSIRFAPTIYFVRVERKLFCELFRFQK